jgi:hypothetical protein
MRAQVVGTPREKKVMRTAAKDIGGISNFGFESEEK